MIRLLLVLFVLTLLSVGFFLLKKPETLLVLMKKETKKEDCQFLKQFSTIFLFLSIFGVLVIILNQTVFSLVYIILILILSTTFSIRFAQKIN